MEIRPEIGSWINETKASLKGYQRRHFMAETVKTICKGSPMIAERELGWNRGPIKKALAEWEGQFCYIDQGFLRGRKKAEEHLTSDFMVDCLTDFWHSEGARFPTVTTLGLNQDNGPENHSRRTQFMNRITQFVDQSQLTVQGNSRKIFVPKPVLSTLCSWENQPYFRNSFRFSSLVHNILGLLPAFAYKSWDNLKIGKAQLAYYPPYHSKYNPIERVWGHLEKHWNGALLDCLDTVVNFACSFRFKQLPPCVNVISKVYATGVKLTQKQMALLEQRFVRLPNLEKWFVRITPLFSAQHV